MAPNEQREIEEQMRALDDRALLRLLAVEAADYRPEALEIARGELRRRNLDYPGQGAILAAIPIGAAGSRWFLRELPVPDHG